MEYINFYTVVGYFILRSATKGFLQKNFFLMLVDKYLSFFTIIVIIQVLAKIICIVVGSKLI